MVMAGVAGQHVHLVLETVLFLEDLKTGLRAPEQQVPVGPVAQLVRAHP